MILGKPNLWLSPTAFAKMIHMMNKSSNECGSFGICPDPKRPFYVSDFIFPKQEVSTGKVDFDDESVGLFQEKMDNLGLEPFQYMRVWQHCHPGNSPNPSSVDESTLREQFGSFEYMVMLIIARDHSMYARLRINTGKIVLEQEMDIYIDYSTPFAASNFEAWDKEYSDNVAEKKWTYVGHNTSHIQRWHGGHENFFGVSTEGISTTTGCQEKGENETKDRDDRILEMWDRLSTYDDGEKLVLMYSDSHDIYEFEPKRKMFYGESTGHQVDPEIIHSPNWAKFIFKHHDFILELLKTANNHNHNHNHNIVREKDEKRVIIIGE